MGTEPTVDTNSDDQELAKALAGMNQETPATASETSGDLAFEETPAPNGPVSGSPFGPITDPVVAAPAPDPVVVPEPAAEPVVATPVVAAPATDSKLESIKKDALNELRPLVDKLTVSAEEKFDTYLLLLRSTDDTTLIGPAHEAAKDIPDEARRAQALLDVIKEIDYLSANDKHL
jgi:hypothetical protein